MNPFASSYLYGLEHALPRTTIDAYVVALVAVARADGIVESESRIIQGVADILGAAPFTVSRALEDDSPDRLDGAVEVLREQAPHMLDLLYRDALMVAWADGQLSDEERAHLLRISSQLGLDKDRRDRATDAAERLNDLRGWTRDLVARGPQPPSIEA